MNRLLYAAATIALTAPSLLACRGRERVGNAAAASASASAQSTPARPKFVSAPKSNVQPFIYEQLQSAGASGERVLVYVGATWCEPCQHFHHAVERGELDALLAGTRLLEFDADRDGAALREAGYASRLIPLIAVPNPDGRASGKQLSGSIKGPDAVKKNLVPRLTALLEGRDVE